MTMNKFIIEYIRRSDIEEDCPDVYVRHCKARSGDAAKSKLLAKDTENDILICSVSTENDYLRFTRDVINDPENSVDAL